MRPRIISSTSPSYRIRKEDFGAEEGHCMYLGDLVSILFFSMFVKLAYECYDPLISQVANDEPPHSPKRALTLTSSSLRQPKGIERESLTIVYYSMNI